MPSAHSVAVADAVVAHLVAASSSLAQPIAPVRSYADWEKPLETERLEECDRLMVDVVAVEPAPDFKVDIASRNSLRYLIPVDIALRERFGSAQQNDDTGRIELARVDALVLLTQQIWESFSLERLATLEGAVWDSEHPPKIAANPLRAHLREFRQFTGIVRVTFRVHSDVA